MSRDVKKIKQLSNCVCERLQWTILGQHQNNLLYSRDTVPKLKLPQKICEFENTPNTSYKGHFKINYTNVVKSTTHINMKSVMCNADRNVCTQKKCTPMVALYPVLYYTCVWVLYYAGKLKMGAQCELANVPGS